MRTRFDFTKYEYQIRAYPIAFRRGFTVCHEMNLESEPLCPIRTTQFIPIAKSATLNMRNAIMKRFAFSIPAGFLLHNWMPAKIPYPRIVKPNSCSTP